VNSHIYHLQLNDITIANKSQEVTHYEMLDTIAEKMTQDETEKMVYHHMHKKHLKEIAEIKYIVSLI
jgi:UDP-2,3-diacylglucosamine pyrophosphatase LpxH